MAIISVKLVIKNYTVMHLETALIASRLKVTIGMHGRHCLFHKHKKSFTALLQFMCTATALNRMLID